MADSEKRQEDAEAAYQDGETHNTTEVVCPFCLAQQKDMEEIDFGGCEGNTEIDCGSCGDRTARCSSSTRSIGSHGAGKA